MGGKCKYGCNIECNYYVDSKECVDCFNAYQNESNYLVEEE